ncbi:MAG: hypothetical protein AB7K24_24565 [Gemmataceae bacterium]
MSRSRRLPARLIVIGVLCCAGGYAALEYSTRQAAAERQEHIDRAVREQLDNGRAIDLQVEEPDQPLLVPGRLAFYFGLAFLVVGCILWVQQPPARRKRRKERVRVETFSPPDDDDGLELVPCPYCGESIYEDSVRCPECGNYLSEEDEARPPRRLPIWFALGLCAALFVALSWILSR